MALAKCKECGNEVSTKAKACPKCGAPAPAPENKALPGWFSILILGAVGIWIYSMIPGSGSSTSRQPTAVDACVQRGVEYFKEVGSYPVLTADPNKGRKAEDVARERCQRTTTAF